MLRLILCFTLMLNCTSCLDTTNEHLESMEKNTEKLAKEVEADREYIKSITEDLKRLTDALVALQYMSTQLFQLFMEVLTQKTPPAQTPDLNDYLEILNPNQTPFPSPSPSAFPSATPSLAPTPHLAPDGIIEVHHAS